MGKMTEGPIIKVQKCSCCGKSPIRPVSGGGKLELAFSGGEINVATMEPGGLAV